MANLATTTYKVTGTREAVNNLWTTLQNMEVDSKDIWLFKLAYEEEEETIITFFHLRQKPHGMPVTNSSLK